MRMPLPYLYPIRPAFPVYCVTERMRMRMPLPDPTCPAFAVYCVAERMRMRMPLPYPIYPSSVNCLLCGRAHAHAPTLPHRTLIVQR